MKLSDIKKARQEKRQKGMKKRFEKHSDKTGVKIVKEFKETGEYRDVKISDILPDQKFQIRTEKLPKEKFDELKESIKTKGQLTPVYLKPKGKKYQIISGFNRAEACKQLHLSTVKAIVKDIDDKAAFLIAETENIQRHNLTVLDMINHISKLETKQNLTQSEMSKRLNISDRQIRNYKAVSSDKKVLDYVTKQNVITLDEGAKIANMPEEQKKQELSLISKLLTQKKNKKAIKAARKKAKSPAPYVINPAKNKIKISISETYKNKDKVAKLLTRILRELKK